MRILLAAMVVALLWIATSTSLALVYLDKRQTTDSRFCTLDRALVSILDPGYKTLSKSVRTALLLDITTIQNQSPCTITYIPLPKGTP